MIAKKRIISMIMVALMAVAMMPAIAWNTYADDNDDNVVENEGLRYRVEHEDDSYTAIVLGPTDSNVEPEINIPQYIISGGEVCFVTEIGDNAFHDCSSLSSVTFADNSMLTTIGSGAFRNCSSLAAIDIPSSVNNINSYAFDANVSLASISIPKQVVMIGENAFHDCSSLSSVTFADNSRVTTIGSGAFSNCSSLVAIDIPSSVNEIHTDAFSKTGLRSVVLPGGLEVMAPWMFSECKSLEEITIPSTVKEICTGAFEECTSLEKIHFGGSRPQWKAITGSGKPNREPDDYGIPEIFLDSFKMTIPDGRKKAFPGDTITISIETEVTDEHDVSQVAFNFLSHDDTGYPISMTFTASKTGRNAETNRDVWEASEVIGSDDINVWKAADVVAICSPKPSMYWDPAAAVVPYPSEPKADLSFMQFEVINACNPHTSGEAVREKEVAASCDTAGSYEEVTYCTTCGKELSREAKVIPALEHDWGDWVVTTPATCTSAGEETRTCKRDPSHIDKRGTEPDPNAHDWNDGEVTKAPTCTAVGNKHFTCTLCGAEKDEAIPAAGHKWNSSLTIDKAATYAAAGSKSIHCSVCNAKKPNSAVSIPKLKVKAATLSGITPGKKGFTAKWKKVSSVSGYQLQYALNSKFTKSKKTIKITKPGTVSKTVTKLKGKKKYYVRIRAYKTESGKTYYSSWSKSKTVTTKK